MGGPEAGSSLPESFVALKAMKAGMLEWADRVADAIDGLRAVAGPFARDPSDADAAAAALEAGRSVAELLADREWWEPMRAFAGDDPDLSSQLPWLETAADELAAALDGIAPLAKGEGVDDPRALAKPVSVWLRGADKEMKSWKREIAELQQAEAASRAEAEILAARRSKLDRLREQGVEPFPYEFDGAVAISGVRAAHADLEPGSETDVRHRVAGRLASRRDQVA